MHFFLCTPFMIGTQRGILVIRVKEAKQGALGLTHISLGAQIMGSLCRNLRDIHDRNFLGSLVLVQPRVLELGGLFRNPVLRKHHLEHRVWDSHEKNI